MHGAGQLPDAGFPALAGMDPRNAGGAPRARRIPRARGDGPSGALVSLSTSTDSPRSRGWTLNRLERAIHKRGFPALAGMDPQREAAHGSGSRIPRARGDGPRTRPARMRRRPDSPRSRGWTRGESGGQLLLAGFPALAGMDPTPGARGAFRHGIPRARGDGPWGGWLMRPSARDSPRSRGWTPAGPGHVSIDLGFPALAGMDLADEDPGGRPARIPRARGDGPGRPGFWTETKPDSPRSRGWTRVMTAWLTAAYGFPALAGMDPARPPVRHSEYRIPRARGDGPFSVREWSDTSRDSPRSRGWTRPGRPDRHGRAGFPALAGMDREVSMTVVIRNGIPRARGDGPNNRLTALLEAQDSPRSRGWTVADLQRLPARDGFPALAGMDRPRRGVVGRGDRIPRARGDGPEAPRPAPVPARDSPRSRGWTRFVPRAPEPAQGFPALAGMDLTETPRGGVVGRIPRARGDGPRAFSAAFRAG